MAGIRLYNSINVIVLALTVLLFFRTGHIENFGLLLFEADVASVIVTDICVTVMIVNILKALRLYFELYEKDISIGLFIRQYCKVTPISIVIPFKLGDIFRAYCYGHVVKDFSVGVAVIAFDRFVDTCALVTLFLLAYCSIGFQLSWIFFTLLFTLVILMLLYFSCPGMCKYWTRYFVFAEGSQSALNILKIIKGIEQAYLELRTVVNGKFLLTYVISLLAWGAELGGIVYCYRAMSRDMSLSINEYLSCIITGGNLDYLSGYVCISTILLIFIYVVAFCTDRIRKGIRL